MILELAVFDIKIASQIAFENAMPAARDIISQSKGFKSIRFEKCIEIEGKYLAFIHWETLEDHTEGFRNSELFVQWRALISPFFETLPTVNHYKTIEI